MCFPLMVHQSRMLLKVEQSPSSFISDCVKGLALLDDIDDYISLWHKGGTNMPLHTFLGMSQEEYNAWLIDDDVLPYIVKARKERVEFDSVAQHDYQYALAARSQGNDNIASLMQWLKKEGILK